MAQSSSAMLYGHLKFKEHVTDLLQPAFQFRGSFDDSSDVADPKTGNIILVGDSTLLYTGEAWTELGISTSSNSSVICDGVHDYIDRHSYKDIKVSVCPHCAATLPLTRIDDAGICTCEYCGSPVYVY